MRRFRQPCERRHGPLPAQPERSADQQRNTPKNQKLIENERLLFRFRQPGVHRRNALQQAIGPEKRRRAAEVQQGFISPDVGQAQTAFGQQYAGADHRADAEELVELEGAGEGEERWLQLIRAKKGSACANYFLSGLCREVFGKNL